MSRDPTQPGQPVCRFAVHYGVALLALLAALVLQTAWPIISSREPASSWWPVDALVIAFATCYALATAWLHLQAATWRPDERERRLWRLVRAMTIDVLVAAIAVMLLVRGPEASALRAGLSILSPVLIAVAAVSLVVTAISAGVCWRSGSRETTVAEAIQPPQFDHVRMIAALLLLLAILALDRFELGAKVGNHPAAQRVTSR